jgi:hypothetical protein
MWGGLVVPRIQILEIPLKGIEHFEEDTELLGGGLTSLGETTDDFLGGQPLPRQHGLLT